MKKLFENHFVLYWVSYYKSCN